MIFKKHCLTARQIHDGQPVRLVPPDLHVLGLEDELRGCDAGLVQGEGHGVIVNCRGKVLYH